MCREFCKGCSGFKKFVLKKLVRIFRSRTTGEGCGGLGGENAVQERSALPEGGADIRAVNFLAGKFKPWQG